jgi:hypothetical protein
MQLVETKWHGTASDFITLLNDIFVSLQLLVDGG